MTAIGAGATAFAAGLFVDESHPRNALLAAMSTTSLLSLGIAVFIARSERQQRRIRSQPD